ncbi:MAG: response regulator [Acidobacteriota bacterium]
MSGYKILIVDDTQEVHDVVGAYLKYSGYDVLHAANGAEGLEMMKREPPDLVLLDIQMPTLDGFGVLEQMKDRRPLADIPVMFLSSLDRPNLKVKGLQMGADDYVVKPFDRAELMARVTVALRRGERFRRLERTFGGQLGPVNVEELLQTMDLGDKNGLIELPDMDAAVEVSGRQVIRARWAGFEGIAAVRRIFLLEGGRFEVDFEAAIEPSEDPVGKIQDILLSAMVYLDELQDELGDQLAFETQVEPSGHDPALEFSGEFYPVWPAAVGELIARMGGDLKENAKTMTGAVAFGAIVTVG